MRRRLDLAAALVHRPPVLFLDEPTTGLDPQGRNELWGVIEDLVGGGTTVLLTTQYLEEADRLADNIVVIDHGSVIAEGTAAELKDRLGRDGDRDRDARRRRRGACRRGARARRQPSRDGKLVRVNVPGGAGARSMLEAVRILDGAHLDPTTMVLREPTLDDVFLELTGHTPTSRRATTREDDGHDDESTAARTRTERTAARQPRSTRSATRITMAWRNLLNIKRNPQLLVFATIQPVIFVLMFRYVFGGAIQGSLPAGQTYVTS